MYYFAYGSNLNTEQMKRRCPKARPVGKIELPNARLVFKHVADCEYHPTMSAVGGLWKVTKDCEKALDRYEGCRENGMGLYRKEYITVAVTVDGVSHEGKALIYVMNRDYYRMPDLRYLETIRTGFGEFGLDTKWLDQALLSTKAECAAQNKDWERQQVQQKREERERRRAKPTHSTVQTFDPDDEFERDADGQYLIDVSPDDQEFRDWLDEQNAADEFDAREARVAQNGTPYRRHDNRPKSGYKTPKRESSISHSTFDWANSGFDPVRKCND